MTTAEQRDRLLRALQELVDACAFVSPIAGVVATEASVKHIRQAGRFMAAVEKATRAIASVKGGDANG